MLRKETVFAPPPAKQRIQRIALFAVPFVVLLSFALHQMGSAAMEPPVAADFPEKADVPLLAVLAGKLPLDFRAVTARAGLHVNAIEPLEALGANIVYIQRTAEQTEDGVLEALSTQFPAFQFELLKDDESAFELIDN